MSVKKFNTRIQLKHDVTSAWTGVASSFTPLAGEFIYDSELKNFKMGDGTTAVGNLQYIIGAAKLANWAADATTGSITANDSLNLALHRLENNIAAITGGGVVTSIDSQNGAFTTGNGISSTSNVLNVITTGYLTVGNSGVDIDSSKVVLGTGNNATDTNLMTEGAVKDVIEALDTQSDVTIASKSGKAVTIAAGISETDGIIGAGSGTAITLADVASTGNAEDVAYDNTTSGLTATDVQAAIDEIEDRIDDIEGSYVTSVQGDGTYLEPTSASTGAVTVSHKTITQGSTTSTGTVGSSNTGTTGTFTVPTVTVDGAGHVTSTDTKTITVTFPSASDLGLSSAMHFIGQATVVKTDPSFPAVSGHTGNYEAGDVVLGYGSDNNEYIFDGTNWIVLGDEGSYAQKTVSMIAGNGLTGGGTLEADRTFALDLDSTNANGLYLSGSTDGSKQLAMHIADESTTTGANFGTVKVTSANGLTISSGVVSYAHNTSAITVASESNGVVTINGTLTPDASDAITTSGAITLAKVAKTGDAEDVAYDHTASGLTASDVQSAIDEVAGTAGSAVQSVTVNGVDVEDSSTHVAAITTTDSEDIAWSTDSTTGALSASLVEFDSFIFDCGTATTNTEETNNQFTNKSSHANA